MKRLVLLMIFAAIVYTIASEAGKLGERAIDSYHDKTEQAIKSATE